MARITRRGFHKATLAGSLGYFFTGPAFSVGKVYGANDKLRFACIGVGGKGDSDSNHVANFGEVVAICDIDEKFLAPKAKAWSSAKVFHDYRKLFGDEIMKNVDAVTVSTPDHNHALASIMAMRMGKHVYCQKPLTHTVYEARLMRETAKKNNVCTQMGNQGTSENGLRRAVELVQAGTIGEVTETHIWTNRPVWPQAPYVTAPPKEMPLPKGIHWEEFIGVAPMRPYAEYDDPKILEKFKRKRAYHDFNWRGWWDFGTGAIGDMACHTANMAFMALKLRTPTKVQAEAGDVNNETCPTFAHVTFEFGARGGMKPVTVHWYEGKKNDKLLSPPAELVEKALSIDPKKRKSLVSSGSIIVGTKGFIYSPDDYGAEFYIGPEKEFANVKTRMPEQLTASVGPPAEERKSDSKRDKPREANNDERHKYEWVKAIRAGKSELAFSNFDYASYLTESFLLGNVAIRSGKSFEYDGESGKIRNCPEAEKFLHVEYRKGWNLL